MGQQLAQSAGCRLVREAHGAVTAHVPIR
jgi:hypothetical protein